MIPKFDISIWLGYIFNMHGQYAALRPFTFRETCGGDLVRTLVLVTHKYIAKKFKKSEQLYIFGTLQQLRF